MDRIRIQGKLDDKFTGGSILHLNVENEVSVESIIKLINLCAKQNVRYFAINYNIQICENEHVSVGKKDNCSICGGKISRNLTRIVGFLVDTKLFNKTRREIDYPNRKFYTEI